MVRAARAVVAAVGRLRREPLAKLPGIAEAVEWAEADGILVVMDRCIYKEHDRLAHSLTR